MDVKNSRG